MSFRSQLLVLSIIISFIGSCNRPFAGEEGYKAALEIHKGLLTVDSHTDTPLRFFQPGTDLSVASDPRKGGGKLDFPRMVEGGLDGVFFAVFIGQREQTAEGNEYAKSRALMLFDSIHAVVNRNSSQAGIALTASDLSILEENGKRAVYIGIENGFTIGRDISLLERFYGLGARYVTLCHTSNNDICDSSTDEDGPEHGGLTDFGREVVKEMNRLGMMIDVSHVSDKAFFDVMEITGAPVIASHSNARQVCDNPRNLTDEMLLTLAKNRGVVQLCVLSDYVAETDPVPGRDSAKLELKRKYGDWNELNDSIRSFFAKEWYAIDDIYPPNLANVKQFCDHVDHIVDLVGIDYVGFGSDFDGGAGLANCFDVSELPNITLELLRRGYTKSELQKFWSGNFLRVMKEVEEAAASI